VWYSTFLTRTGVLGDTSVHAFTGEGKSLYWHLLVVLGVLLVLSAVLLLKRWKSLPRVRTEEATSSREFWMAIGSFVLIISAAHIILATSTPIWGPLVEKMTGKHPSITDPVTHYNSIQVWVAILVGLLSATVLFMKFKKSDTKVLFRRLLIVCLAAAVLTALIAFAQHIAPPQYILMLFAAVFGLVSNVYYAFGVQSGALKKRGAALTHFGFAMTLLGILLSSYGKEVISLNTTGAEIPLGKEKLEERIKENRENVILFRGSHVAMGNYFATYLGDSTSSSDPRTFFRVRFERLHPKTNQTEESFMLYPDAFVNPKGQQGLSSNPATRHYLTRDIFTYVNSIYKAKDKGEYQRDTLHEGDTIFFANGFVRFEGFNRDAKNPAYKPQVGDMAVGARLSVHTMNAAAQMLEPLFIIRGNDVSNVDDTLQNLGFYARFSNIIPQLNAAVIETKQRNATDEYIVLKALLFPYINVLWLGIITMVLGFGLSLYNRATKKEGKTQRVV
jgi:cytochrome c-type biogenesis protein CcmF